MKQFMKVDQRVIWVLKALLGAYIITGLLLIVLASLLFKLQLSEQTVNIGIIVIYILSTFLAGLYLGKKFKNKKFIWGLCGGAAYFLVLMLVSLLVNKGMDGGMNAFLTTFLMCALSGTFGGMVA